MSGTLHIDELAVDLVIDRAAPDHAALRRHCTEAVGHRLATALAATLARWCDRDDPSIWLVRRIDLDLPTSTAFSPQELSLDLARSLAITLGRVLVGDGDGIDSIRFPDAAALLAQFLVDAANGDAWSRWYYRRFRGLRMLPTSAVVRTAICDVPAWGLEALQGMDDAGLRRALEALSVADAALVRAGLSTLADAADFVQCIDRCLTAWSGCRSIGMRDDLRALMLVVRASDGDRAGLALDAAVTTVCDLARRLDRIEAATAIASRRLADWPAEARARVVAALAAPTDLAVVDADTSTGASPFGGAFLLLRVMDETMREATDVCASAGIDDETVALSRLLVMCDCLDGANARQRFTDPLLRFACGVPGECVVRTPQAAFARLAASDRGLLDALLVAGARVPRRELQSFAKIADTGARWRRAVRNVAYRVLRSFAARLPGFADSRCTYLRRNFLEVAAKVEFESDRIVVTLSRAPLHLVLSLAGATRASFTLSFGDRRPFALFPAG